MRAETVDRAAATRHCHSHASQASCGLHHCRTTRLDTESPTHNQKTAGTRTSKLFRGSPADAPRDSRGPLAEQPL